jgi:hypothetical protein
MDVNGYLANRKLETLVGPEQLAAAVPLLAEAGTEADRLLVRAEGVKALATRAEAAQFESVIQTLGALSRECWAAHGAAVTASQVYRQLADVEAQLVANLAP